MGVAVQLTASRGIGRAAVSRRLRPAGGRPVMLSGGTTPGDPGATAAMICAEICDIAWNHLPRDNQLIEPKLTGRPFFLTFAGLDFAVAGKQGDVNAENKATLAF